MSLAPHPRLLAYAQLLRLPNVFTAFADIALAACVGVSVGPGRPAGEFAGAVALLALASGCLYLSGMVWNDVFDVAEDTRDRPFRPLPSRRVTLRSAAILGSFLVFAGLGFAVLAGAVVIGVALASAVLLYDAWLKRTPIGPVAMAACRFLNVFLGLTVIPDEALNTGMRVHVAGVVGVYIVGVTWFARTEAGASRRWHLLAAAGVIGAALVLALTLRARLPESPGPGAVLFPYLLVAFGFLVGVPVAQAVRTPGPKEVQRAVKRCVLGLVALDAVLATAFVGAPGLFVLLLLPPALVLGKWVYST
ncbi:MAG: prenyltransferase [Gemmataceae bacterium]|nr:prenyltransferase [Gemmataceae bacterium]